MLHLAVEMHLLLYAAGSACADELYMLTQSYDLTIVSLRLCVSMTKEHVLLLQLLFIRILWKGRETECLFGILMQDDALNKASLNWLIYATVTSSRYIYLLLVLLLSKTWHDYYHTTPWQMLLPISITIPPVKRFNTNIQITCCSFHQETIMIIPIYQPFHKNMFTGVTWYSLGFILRTF